MNFARKQLEKYGWTDGKGLGKNENGISEPIKAKLKRSVAGIGHDQAAEHTDHWWNKLYDKAANNVEVEEKNGKTKKIKTKDETFQITNSSYHLYKSDTKKNQDEEYSDFFIKKSVLTNEGGGEKRIRESDSKEEIEEKKDVFKMTDEELFAACEGRTAHKGARHGLRALGKLARIEQQEQILLADQKYTGYSHTKKHKNDKKNQEVDSEIMESTNLNDGIDTTQIKKKKKKRKRCFSNETSSVNTTEELLPPVFEENDTEMAENDVEVVVECTKRKSDENEESEKVSKRKKKKLVQNEEMDTESTEATEHKIKKNKKKKERDL